MEKRIIFRMHAYSDAAGKSNPGAVRGGNEDNFYVDDNLCDEYPSHCESDVEKELCDYGLIMAVADGMGGMNAGEVASEIAVETVRDYFSPGRINAENSADHQSRKQYLERLIVEADDRIKQDAVNNPDHAGMGSTIILAWIVGNEMTLSWCGDSRAYRFNPATGIELISEDHSYVQELVKKGILTYDQTFEHPQGNIVTRSLGDESRRAQPETRFFNIYDEDIILLCSDGLSGVLRDKKTLDENGHFYPGDNLEDLIRNNHDSLVNCRQVLWKAAEAADWYDNVTAILCEIKSGAGSIPAAPQNAVSQHPVTDPGSDEPLSATTTPRSKSFWSRTVVHITPKGLIYALCALLLIGGGIFAFRSLKNRSQKKETPDLVVKKDSTNVKDSGNVDPEDVSQIQGEIDVDKEQDDNPLADQGSSESGSDQKRTSTSKNKPSAEASNTSAPKNSGDHSSDESNPKDQELTPVSHQHVQIDRFIINSIEIQPGTNYYSIMQAFNSEGYRYKFILSESFERVDPSKLIAGKKYMVVATTNSQDSDAFLDELSQDDVFIMDANNQTIPVNAVSAVKALKSLETMQPYSVFKKVN